MSIVTSTSQFPTPSYIYDSGWKTATFSFTTENVDVYCNIAVRKANNSNLTPSNVSGNHFQIEQGSTATSYKPYKTPIELCQIGSYQDYIYKNNGNWFKHKAIEKVVLNGTENWSYQSQYSRFFIDLSNSALIGARDSSKSNYFVYGNTESVNNTFFISTASRLLIRNESISSANNFKTWLSNNNVTLYYVLNTPTDTQITDSTLISQLDA